MLLTSRKRNASGSSEGSRNGAGSASNSPLTIKDENKSEQNCFQFGSFFQIGLLIFESKKAAFPGEFLLIEDKY